MSNLVMTEEQRKLYDEFSNLAEIYSNPYIGKPYHDDMIQDLRYGVCYAIVTYREDGGSKLSSYIITLLKRRIVRFLRKWYNSTATVSWYTVSYEETMEKRRVESLKDMNSDDETEDIANTYVRGETIDSVRKSIYKMVNEVYEERNTKDSAKKIYNTYLKIVSKRSAHGANQEVAKICGCTRQNVQQVVNKYNALVKEKWEKEYGKQFC